MPERLSGALTQSSIIGVGQDATAGLPVTAEQMKRMSDFIPIGYAVTYIFGTIGSVTFLSIIAPKILEIDLQEECRSAGYADSTYRWRPDRKIYFQMEWGIDFRRMCRSDDHNGISWSCL